MSVVKMADWLPPEVNQKNDDLVTLLAYLLEEAKDGKLKGFTGAFILDKEGQDKNSVGVCSSQVPNRYEMIGALEQCKTNLMKAK